MTATNGMRYLVTGELWPKGYDDLRRRLLAQMGRSVVAVGHYDHIRRFGQKFGTLQYKLGTGPGVWSYNRAVLAAARQQRPDVVWVEKGNLLHPRTLRAIKAMTGAVVVNFNTDFLGSSGNPWRLHMDGISEYDIYFTSHVLDVDLLKSKGVPQVVVVPLGYYGAMFRPLPVSEEERTRLGAEIGFIGHWEPASEDLFLNVLEQGLPLRIRGTSWHHARNKQRLGAALEMGFVPADDYVKSILATKINLGVNSAINRNQTSGRSFEIPAVGGFLLAQRTGEHQALYEEGREAEFYGSVDELVEKARYYLEHDEERKAIAAAGHRRCLASGTSFEEMMPKLAETVEIAVRAKR